ncbi:HMG_box domain-containing protein [Cephalotus follicularis]|uniref:HMG_box domain-containing protein n=1 Tax=Cephalotus follicularis TaxID=3775 RepID=A0A1Q3DAJ2_CEPFO|nr:HMG_box domain-containing protein [Cephalotus follicularis]
MRGPRTALIAQKVAGAKIILKKRKGEPKRGKQTTKDPNAPKRPATAFFVFMEEFRKSFKENFPDNKSVAAVTKAGGENWKSLSDSEKAPYIDKALKRKQEYEKAVEVYKKNSALGGNRDDEQSEKSMSGVHDEDEQEASS